MEGQCQLVHVPNSGRMTQLARNGNPVILLEAKNPARKTRYDWIMARTPGDDGWALTHSGVASQLIERALHAGRLREFAGDFIVRREAPIDEHRFDFRLDHSTGSQCWIEVKSVTFVRSMPWGGEAQFPDAPTTRGLRHVRGLRALRTRGARAAILFAVGRPDASHVSTNAAVDPGFARALWAASEQGVEIYGYHIECDPGRGYRIGASIPVHLTK